MNRFFKWLPAVAAIWLIAGVSHAQSGVQVYGLLDLSIGSFRTSGTQKTVAVDSGNMTTSFLGIKGQEDLGGGLKTVFALAHFLYADKGTAGRFNGDAFWARDAYVGLSGTFGTTTLGRNTTPFFVSTLLFNAFGDSFGFSPAIRQVLTPGLLPFFGDTAWNNSLLYRSADNGSVKFSLIGGLGEGGAGAYGRNIGANMLYLAGPFAATAAYQEVRNGVFSKPAGFAAQRGLQLGTSYDLSVVKLFGQYTREKTIAQVIQKSDIYGFGGSLPLGAGRALVQYGYAKARAGAYFAKHKTLSMGYEHDLSKTVELYAVYMYDKISNLNAGNTIASGIRLSF